VAIELLLLEYSRCSNTRVSTDSGSSYNYRVV